MRSLYGSLLLGAFMLCATPAAHAGVKAGCLFPTAGDFEPSFSMGFDGRFRVTDRLRVGGDIMWVPSLQGPEYLHYDDCHWFGYCEEEADHLNMISLTTGAWYFFTDHVYGGAGIGYYSTSFSGHQLGESTSGDVDMPHGLAVHVSLGYMQKPAERRNFLFFAEMMYLYHDGSGTMEVEGNRLEEVPGPSGIGLFVGVTF